MIGQDPPATFSESVTSPAPGTKVNEMTMRDMIEEADRNAVIVVHEMRQAAAVADEHRDPGTVDLFSRLVQVHEKHEWWLRDILRRKDGPCS